jgi:peroxiredoxin
VAECYGVWGEKDKDGQHIQGVRHAAFLLDPDGVILRCWYHILPAETIRLALEFLNAPG